MTPFSFRLAAFALLAATTSLSAAQAGPDETIKAAAEQAKPAVIDSLREMVLIESGSSDVEGLKKMADLTEGRLKALGATTERRKTTRGVGADMVIGTFEGTGRRKLMLIAHMDTVYQPGILKTEPYHVEGDLIYGPGIADDKGGIAVILHSLQILKDMGWRDYARLTVAFNPDEEVGSIGSGEFIAELADQHDVVLSCEPTAAKPAAPVDSLLLGASGTATATMQVTGRASHAGAAPDRGRNALIELSHQLLQTRDIAKSIPGTQLNWTTATAGTVRNQIPEKASAGGDVRLTVADGVEKLQAALDETTKSHLVPDTEVKVTIEKGRPPFIASDRGRALGKEAQGIYAELERPLALVDMTGGATDAGFANRSGKAIVVESFGIAGFNYHAHNEYIDSTTIVPRLYLMTRMLIEQGKKMQDVTARGSPASRPGASIRETSEENAMQLTPEQIAFFNREGWLFLPELFSPEETAFLAREAEAIYAADRPEVWREKSGAPRTAFAAHLYNDAFHVLAAHPRMIAPIEQIFGEKVYMHQFKINAKSAFTGDVWQWHQDYGTWKRDDGMPEPRAMNIAIFLDEVMPINGPLMLVPRSQHAGDLEASHDLATTSYPLWTLDEATVTRLVAEGGIVAPTGKPGGMLMFHGNLVHGSAGNITPYPRKIVYLTLNAVSNYIRTPTRPEYIAHRDFTPIATLPDDALLQLARAHREAAE